LKQNELFSAVKQIGKSTLFFFPGFWFGYSYNSTLKKMKLNFSDKNNQFFLTFCFKMAYGKSYNHLKTSRCQELNTYKLQCNMQEKYNSEFLVAESYKSCFIHAVLLSWKQHQDCTPFLPFLKCYFWLPQPRSEVFR